MGFLKTSCQQLPLGKKTKPKIPSKKNKIKKNTEEKQTFLLKFWNIKRVLEVVSFSAADNKSNRAGCWQFWSLPPGNILADS